MDYARIAKVKPGEWHLHLLRWRAAVGQAFDGALAARSRTGPHGRTAMLWPLSACWRLRVPIDDEHMPRGASAR